MNEMILVCKRLKFGDTCTDAGVIQKVASWMEDRRAYHLSYKDTSWLGKNTKYFQCEAIILCMPIPIWCEHRCKPQGTIK